MPEEETAKKSRREIESPSETKEEKKQKRIGRQESTQMKEHIVPLP